MQGKKAKYPLSVTDNAGIKEAMDTSWEIKQEMSFRKTQTIGYIFFRVKMILQGKKMYLPTNSEIKLLYIFKIILITLFQALQ